MHFYPLQSNHATRTLQTEALPWCFKMKGMLTMPNVHPFLPNSLSIPSHSLPRLYISLPSLTLTFVANLIRSPRALPMSNAQNLGVSDAFFIMVTLTSAFGSMLTIGNTDCQGQIESANLLTFDIAGNVALYAINSLELQATTPGSYCINFFVFCFLFFCFFV
jgi:hypothetical protein